MRPLSSYLLATLLCFTAAGAAAQEYKVIKAQDDLYFVGDRTFSAFLITAEGVIVFDPINEEHAKATLQAIRKVTKQPVRYLFYSHNHWDHISGGKVFKEVGATVISHRQALEQLKPNEKVVPPDTTWSGDRSVFTLGGRTLELYYFGENHGAGMTVFRFPHHNTVFTVDLVVPDRVLFAYLPDASPKKWVATLRKIEGLSFDKLYMAHERAIGDRKDLTLVLRYFDDLYNAVEKEMQRGTPPFDIPQKISLPQYRHLKMYDEWLHLNAWRILMEKTIGE